MFNFSEMTDEQKKWRGRDDARCLAEANAIKKDADRLANAQAQAIEIYNERANALAEVAPIVGVKAPNTFNKGKGTLSIKNPATVSRL